MDVTERSPVSSGQDGGSAAPAWIAQLFPGRAGRAARQQRRLAVLNRALARDPELASGYVLRAELYLSAGQVDQAITDFSRALALLERQLDTERWGVVTQTMRDRALSGLEQAKLRRNP
jgi:tetratricopeptide (TPR) repeat protein